MGIPEIVYMGSAGCTYISMHLYVGGKRGKEYVGEQVGGTHGSGGMEERGGDNIVTFQLKIKLIW